MALDNYANFVRGSLTAAVDNSQTTFPVNNASIFPDTASGNYNLVVWDVGSHPRPDQDPDVEVVRVTGRDTGTDELTVTRGQEATTGVSHPSGSALHLSYTAKLAADIETDYVAEGENFDGQGTSQFTNLASFDTDDLTVAGQQSMSDLTVISRTADTWYQNTEGVPIMISVKYNASASSGDSVRYLVDVNTSENTQNITGFGMQSAGADITEGVTFPVPNNSYYKVSEVRDDAGGNLEWYRAKMGF